MAELQELIDLPDSMPESGPCPDNDQVPDACNPGDHCLDLRDGAGPDSWPDKPSGEEEGDADSSVELMMSDVDAGEQLVGGEADSSQELASDNDAEEQCNDLEFELLCIFKNSDIPQPSPCPPGIEDPMSKKGLVGSYEELESYALCGYCDPSILDYFGKGAIVNQFLAVDNSSLAYCCPTAYQYCPGQDDWTFVVEGQCAFEFLGESSKSFTTFLLLIQDFPEGEPVQIAMYETSGNVEFHSPDRAPYYNLKAECESLACCNP
jgi:hypothetical protein